MFYFWICPNCRQKAWRPTMASSYGPKWECNEGYTRNRAKSVTKPKGAARSWDHRQVIDLLVRIDMRGIWGSFPMPLQGRADIHCGQLCAYYYVERIDCHTLPSALPHTATHCHTLPLTLPHTAFVLPNTVALPNSPTLSRASAGTLPSAPPHIITRILPCALPQTASRTAAHCRALPHCRTLPLSLPHSRTIRTIN
jgi:hypothetical protein